VRAAAREIDQLLGERALPSPPTPARLLPLKAWSMLRAKGPMTAAREVIRYLRWKMGI
jgi:hypothetical protein